MKKKNLALALIEFFRGGPENFSGDFTEIQINLEGGHKIFRALRAQIYQILILIYCHSLLCLISLLYSRVLLVSGSDVTDKVRTFHRFREDVIKHIF